MQLEHELEEKETELESLQDEKNILLSELLQSNVSDASQ